jgi:hypothetical protein
MEAPREVRIAIFLSWVVVLLELSERLWRISVSDWANTFARFRLTWTVETLSAAVVVGLFVFFASRRRNWGRIALLVSTLGGWLLWYIWTRTVTDYSAWQWVLLASVTIMELVALYLLFLGRGAEWYRSAPRR